ncbi:MAG: protease modulator HflC [Ectothiorhodospiraceae bacterium]|nr:protease modulator HflC [Chromatiales bacterium]MCP5157114.1 protease modulator HflC [Ectothiorhodospiraceae bacterium]
MSKAYVVGGAIALVLLSLSVFTVDERERAIKLQLGEIKRSDYEPGIHLKAPLVQQVLRFDARIQTLDSEPQLYLTSEKKQVIVDSFVRWRIDDVERYYTTTGGNPVVANQRLSVGILKRLRDEFGKRTIQQVVSGERGDIMDRLTVSAREQAEQLGVEIVDVRVKRVDLPEKVSQSVYDRMAAERKKVARQFRSEGEERAREIRAEADREREVIIASAEREAQIMRGEGDARATDIYARAFGQDAEFYSLYRSLNAYRSTFNRPSDVLLIEPEGRFFRYFKESTGTRP